MIIRLSAICFLALSVFAFAANAETVRWARSGDAATLDPHASADAMSMQLNRNIYEPLVERDADGQLAPGLATSWQAKAGNAAVWTFGLKSYAQFHDGSDFSADDVVFSFTRAKGANSALASKLADIVSVTAIDPATVEIRFAVPTPALPAALSDVLIMDKKWATANGVVAVKKPGEGKESFSTRHANGTGPYTLQSREPDVRTALVANENYPGAAAAADTIIYLPIVNPAMLAKALQWGEVDVLQDVPLSDIEKISATDGLKVETATANKVLYLGFGFGAKSGATGADAAKNPFDNPRVRSAIDMALDRDNIATFVDRGYAKPTNMLAAPFVDGWTSPLAAPQKPDREMTAALLFDAKYPDGFAVKFDVARDDAPAANRIASMLASAGIWADVVTRTRAAHLAYINSGSSQMYLADYVAPGYDSGAIFDWLANGRAGYVNADLSARIAALSGINETERGAAIAAIWNAIQKEHIVLPIAQRVLAHAMRGGIALAVDPNNQTRFETIQIGK